MADTRTPEEKRADNLKDMIASGDKNPDTMSESTKSFMRSRGETSVETPTGYYSLDTGKSTSPVTYGSPEYVRRYGENGSPYQQLDTGQGTFYESAQAGMQRAYSQGYSYTQQPQTMYESRAYMNPLAQPQTMNVNGLSYNYNPATNLLERTTSEGQTITRPLYDWSSAMNVLGEALTRGYIVQKTSTTPYVDDKGINRLKVDDSWYEFSSGVPSSVKDAISKTLYGFGYEVSKSDKIALTERGDYKMGAVTNDNMFVQSGADKASGEYINYFGKDYKVTKVTESGMQLERDGKTSFISAASLYAAQGGGYETPAGNFKLSGSGGSYKISGSFSPAMSSDGLTNIDLWQLKGKDIVESIRPKTLNPESAVKQAVIENRAMNLNTFDEHWFSDAPLSANTYRYDMKPERLDIYPKTHYGYEKAIETISPEKLLGFEKASAMGKSMYSSSATASNEAIIKAMPEFKTEVPLKYTSPYWLDVVSGGKIKGSIDMGSLNLDYKMIPKGGAYIVEATEQQVKTGASALGLAYAGYVSTKHSSDYEKGSALGYLSSGAEYIPNIPIQATFIAGGILSSRLPSGTPKYEDKLVYREGYIRPETQMKDIGGIPQISPDQPYLITEPGKAAAYIPGKGFAGYSTYREGTDAYAAKAAKDTLSALTSKSTAIVPYGEGIVGYSKATTLRMPVEQYMLNPKSWLETSATIAGLQAGSNIASGKPIDYKVGDAFMGGAILYPGMMGVGKTLSMPRPMTQSEIEASRQPQMIYNPKTGETQFIRYPSPIPTNPSSSIITNPANMWELPGKGETFSPKNLIPTEHGNIVETPPYKGYFKPDNSRTIKIDSSDMIDVSPSKYSSIFPKKKPFSLSDYSFKEDNYLQESEVFSRGQISVQKAIPEFRSLYVPDQRGLSIYQPKELLSPVNYLASTSTYRMVNAQPERSLSPIMSLKPTMYSGGKMFEEYKPYQFSTTPESSLFISKQVPIEIITTKETQINPQVTIYPQYDISITPEKTTTTNYINYFNTNPPPPITPPPREIIPYFRGTLGSFMWGAGEPSGSGSHKAQARYKPSLAGVFYGFKEKRRKSGDDIWSGVEVRGLM